MTRLSAAAAVVLGFAAIAALPWRTNPSTSIDSARMRSGQWAGGFGAIGGDRPNWDPLTGQFRVEGSRLEGKLLFSDGEESLRGKQTGASVGFSFTRNGRGLRCTGTLDGDSIHGECVDARGTYSLELIREHRSSDAELLELTGLYEVGADHKIAVSKSVHLIFTDFKRGLVRVLYDRGNDTFVAGSTYAVPNPSQWLLTFSRDPQGRIAGLTIAESDGTTLRARAGGRPVSEEMTVAHAGVELRGTLFLPEGPGPHPAVVYVHGSGRQTRAGAGSWPYFFVDHGFAVLAMDKRGVGQSGGRYKLQDDGHDNLPHMERRATDVLAAVRSLRKRPDIDPGQVGLVGGSQAGWVMPMASGTGEVAFTIALSGGATALSYESIFSVLAAEMDSSKSAPSVEQILEQMQDHRPRDPDFREHFAAQACPGLWLYGLKDRSNPSQLCIDLLEEIRRTTGKDFTIKAFPDGNHGLRVCRFGGAAEARTLGRLVPGLHQTVSDWLGAKGFGPKARRAWTGAGIRLAH